MNATATIAPAEPHSVDQGHAVSPQHAVGPQRSASQQHSDAPQHSGEPQHMRALERANQVRLARAELKRRVASGEVGVAEVILDCPWEAQSMAVADLLMSQRRWGHTRCRKFLAQIPMSEQKSVGSMTERQRRTLAAMLTPAGAVTMPSSPWVVARRMQSDEQEQRAGLLGSPRSV